MTSKQLKQKNNKRFPEPWETIYRMFFYLIVIVGLGIGFYSLSLLK